MSNDAAKDRQNDTRRGLVELAIATIPTVLVYVVGWAYLDSYLKSFGIGISELDLDIQTILIYAYPPILLFWKSYWGVFLGATATLVVTGWLAHRFWPGSLKNALAVVSIHIRGTSPIVLGLLLFIVLISISFLSVPLVHIYATQAAGRKWVSEGVHIQAMVKEPDTTETSIWYERYKQCANRRALDLIFADKHTYYMLCISTVDETSALVFEVRREVGLASVRFIQR